MPKSRGSSLLFLALGAGIFAATNADLLPAWAFVVGLLLSGAGLVGFLKANRAATAQEERRLERALRPDIAKNAGRAYAGGGQARRAEDLGVAEVADGPERHRAESMAAAEAAPQRELVLDVPQGRPGGADEFQVSTDLSVPVEVQERSSLAEELKKLTQLRDDGILSAEEFHAAKAKLLG